jgi:beta-galactosidase
MIKEAVYLVASLCVAASQNLPASPDAATHVSASTGDNAIGERVAFNTGWRFTKGESEGAGDSLAYPKIKDWLLFGSRAFTTNATLLSKQSPPGEPGIGVRFARPDFDDSQWLLLNLPHDWGIEGPFKQEYPGKTGKLPWWGVGWYRKHLAIPASDTGRKIYFDMDGAMSYATVWLNGHFVGGWPYGYASWRADLTPFIKYGADNVMAIRLENPKESSR